MSNKHAVTSDEVRGVFTALLGGTPGAVGPTLVSIQEAPRRPNQESVENSGDAWPDDGEGTPSASLFPDPPVPQATIITAGTWAAWDDAMVHSLQAAAWKSVDVETTALTPTSRPEKAKKGADSTVRCRVISAAWPREDGQTQQESWDLDMLTPVQRRYLARACLSGTLIAHNAGFDLYWLRHLAGENAPWLAEVIDTMLLARIAAPDTPERLVTTAKPGNEWHPNPYTLEQREAAAGHIPDESSPASKGDGGFGWSLNAQVLVAFGMVLDKEFQKPANWMTPSPLGREKYAYATGDVYWALNLLLHYIGSKGADHLADAWGDWKSQHPEWDDLLRGQVEAVVQIRETGMPWSLPAAETLAAKYRAKAERYGRLLAKVAPAMASHVSALVGGTMNAATRDAFAAALSSIGAEVPQTKNGAPATSEDSLAVAGLLDRGHPARIVAGAMVRAKKNGDHAARLQRDYSSLTGPDGRIHPLLGHGAATGRLSSREPNVQNLPRDPEFRACVQAPPGHVVVAIDYSQIELRVAAALAIRCQQEIAQWEQENPWGEMFPEADWDPDAMAAAWASHEAAREEAFSAEGKVRNRAFKEADAAERRAVEVALCQYLSLVRAKAHEARTPEWSAMRDVFMAGGDPHLRTALGMLGRDPDLALDPVKAKAAKGEPGMSAHRQAAKAVGFGLLYGMQASTLVNYAKANYGVAFTAEEAEERRAKWFELYPEIRLWHMWTEWKVLVKGDKGKVWGARKRNGQVLQAPYRVYPVATLTGRQYRVLQPRQALNYQDQGSAADIMMRALVRLRADHPGVYRYLANNIHDELLFVCPVEEAGYVAEVAERVMLLAAGVDLGRFGVPCAAEASRRKDGSWPDHWVH